METKTVRAALAALLLSTGCSGIRIEVMEPLPSSRFDAQACVEQALRRNPNPADLPMAVAHFRKACSEADPAGCSMLGVMYERGAGVARDEARAVDLYERACAGGNEAGCVNLGRALAAGRGVPANADRALAYFAAACRGEHAPGCTELARLFARGRGVPKSPRQAALFFGRACDKGEVDACYELGRLHEASGRDTLSAIVLYEKACTGGVMSACEGVARVSSPREACAPGDCALARVKERNDSLASSRARAPAR